MIDARERQLAAAHWISSSLVVYGPSLGKIIFQPYPLDSHFPVLQKSVII
jgi:hypothetical protein